MRSMFEPVYLAEAAYLSGVGAREMNRVIDEGILPPAALVSANGRQVVTLACAMIRFYFQTAPSLSADLRRRVVTWMSERLLTADARRAAEPGAHELTFREGAVQIDLAQFVKETFAASDDLRRAEAAVVSNPEIMDGEPVLKGTRIPARMIVGMLESGDSRKQLLSGYPSLTSEALDAAVKYVRAHPPRGRPSQKPVRDVFPQARLVTRRTINISSRRSTGVRSSAVRKPA